MDNGDVTSAYNITYNGKGMPKKQPETLKLADPLPKQANSHGLKAVNPGLLPPKSPAGTGLELYPRQVKPVAATCLNATSDTLAPLPDGTRV